jgi:hypothetical protein
MVYLQKLMKPGSPSMQMRADRSLPRSEDRRDLFERVARVVVENDRGSLALREL